MSYMGAYVLWLEEEGLEPSLKYWERYHKENPNMIPKPREPRETIRGDDVKDT
jgi:hypothetical protein